LLETDIDSFEKLEVLTRVREASPGLAVDDAALDSAAMRWTVDDLLRAQLLEKHERAYILGPRGADVAVVELLALYAADTMAEAVYILCALTSLFCAGLLIRSYRAQRTRLLLWSSLAFIGLAVDNAVLVVDLIVLPQTDLSWLRLGVAAVAMFLLLVGLIWESR
jgi:hypothetical protein